MRERTETKQGTSVKMLTVAEVREADRRCIEELGIPGVVLMNNAGSVVFREVDKGPVGVVCGKGNNGGDGFVVARMALAAGYETRVALVGNRDDIVGDAAVFMRAYENLGGVVACVPEEHAAAEAVTGFADCGVVIDALLGTGVKGEARGAFKAAIDAWPSVRTIAVDLPSGLNADTGEPCGSCVRADVTVTFQFAKRGFENPAAAGCLGRLVVADIGIPAVCADDAAWRVLRGGR